MPVRDSIESIQTMNEKILLVDDDEGLRMALSDRLRREGYAVNSAADAEAGFRRATSLPFDLMIFDIILPQRSGLDLCRDIRRAGLGTPVLMLTARRASEDIIAGFKAGADAYVTKPFDMMELSARIEALLRRVGKGTRQDVDLRPNALVVRKPLDEIDLRRAAAKTLAPLVEVVPGHRTIVDEERQAPQRHNVPVLRSVADGVIEFLEGVFVGPRSPGPRSAKDI